jgi:hypothetical protein
MSGSELYPNESHVYHHNDGAPEIKLKAEHLQKGWNTEVAVTCNDPDEALELLAKLTASMNLAYPAAPPVMVKEKEAKV